MIESLGIKKIEENNETRPRTFLFYGRSGTGKTTIATSTGNALVLDINEDGTGVATTGFVKSITSFQEFKMICSKLKEIHKDLKFDTLVIDTVGKLADLSLESVTGGKKAQIQDYGENKRNMEAVINYIKRISREIGFDVVYIAHEKESSGAFSDGSIINPSVSCDLQAKIQTFLEGSVDAIGHTRIITNEETQYQIKFGGDSLFNTKIQTNKRHDQSELTLTNATMADIKALF